MFWFFFFLVWYHRILLFYSTENIWKEKSYQNVFFTGIIYCSEKLNLILRDILKL